ncbi:hypothetical protein Tco_0030428, partial [Tanacetum coccineum]
SSGSLSVENERLCMHILIRYRNNFIGVVYDCLLKLPINGLINPPTLSNLLLRVFGPLSGCRIRKESQDNSDFESANLPKADSVTAIRPKKESNQEEMVYADGGDNEDKID